jgi:hypothetical protein
MKQTAKSAPKGAITYFGDAEADHSSLNFL